MVQAQSTAATAGAARQPGPKPTSAPAISGPAIAPMPKKPLAVASDPSSASASAELTEPVRSPPPKLNRKALAITTAPTGASASSVRPIVSRIVPHRNEVRRPRAQDTRLDASTPEPQPAPAAEMARPVPMSPTPRSCRTPGRIGPSDAAATPNADRAYEQMRPGLG